MASSKDYLEFVLGQLSELDDIIYTFKNRISRSAHPGDHLFRAEL